MAYGEKIENLIMIIIKTIPSASSKISWFFGTRTREHKESRMFSKYSFSSFVAGSTFR